MAKKKIDRPILFIHDATSDCIRRGYSTYVVVVKVYATGVICPLFSCLRMSVPRAVRQTVFERFSWTKQNNNNNYYYYIRTKGYRWIKNRVFNSAQIVCGKRYKYPLGSFCLKITFSFRFPSIFFSFWKQTHITILFYIVRLPTEYTPLLYYIPVYELYTF